MLLALCLLIGCSNAPELAVVPDVTEADKDTATAALTGLGFVPVVKEISDPSIPAGTVLRTDPPAGSYVAIGGKVYLWVTTDDAATTPLPTTSAPHLSTTTPQTSTSVTRPSTSLHTTTTTAFPSTTTTALCDSGHRFGEGVCSVCGARDPNHVNTLSVGQTWTVENQWSFTILAVTAHNRCNPIQNNAEDATNRQVILLRYAYENLGFSSKFDDLLVDDMSFTITQNDGKPAAAYACDHTQFAVPCAVGECCTAEEAFAVDETCRRITLLVSLRTSDGRGVQRVQFDVPLP